MAPFLEVLRSGGGFHWAASIRGGAAFCSGQKRHLLGYGSAFLQATQTIAPGLAELLIHCVGVPHGTVSDQRAHFTAKEEQQQDLAHGTPWACCAPHHHKVPGLTAHGSVFGRCSCSTGRWEALSGRVQGSPEAVYALSRRLIHDTASLRARNEGFKEMGVADTVLVDNWLSPSRPWSVLRKATSTLCLYRTENA